MSMAVDLATFDELEMANGLLNDAARRGVPRAVVFKNTSNNRQSVRQTVNRGPILGCFTTTIHTIELNARDFGPQRLSRTNFTHLSAARTMARRPRGSGARASEACSQSLPPTRNMVAALHWLERDAARLLGDAHTGRCD